MHPVRGGGAVGRGHAGSRTRMRDPFAIASRKQSIAYIYYPQLYISSPPACFCDYSSAQTSPHPLGLCNFRRRDRCCCGFGVRGLFCARFCIGMSHRASWDWLLQLCNPCEPPTTNPQPMSTYIYCRFVCVCFSFVCQFYALPAPPSR